MTQQEREEQIKADLRRHAGHTVTEDEEAMISFMAGVFGDLGVEGIVFVDDTLDETTDKGDLTDSPKVT